MVVWPQVFLLAATNLPWELDMALLRRLEKRVHVPFPTTAARAWMVRRLLPPDRLHSPKHVQARHRLRNCGPYVVAGGFSFQN